MEETPERKSPRIQNNKTNLAFLQELAQAEWLLCLGGLLAPFTSEQTPAAPGDDPAGMGKDSLEFFAAAQHGWSGE